MYKKVSYIADGKLQLLRQALQAQGLDGWERRTLSTGVPILSNDYELATVGPARESENFIGYQDVSMPEAQNIKDNDSSSRP